MLKPTRNVLILLAILALAGLVGWRMWPPGPIITTGIDADSPLSMPTQGGLDHRFDFLTAWQSVQIPQARRFDPPMGSNHAGFIYDAQKFWDMNEKRHGHHTGDDLNGIGGMDTDLGDPVYSTADGLVLCAGDFSGGWGKLVVVAHTAPDGRRLHSMYAHLDRIDVAVGDLIPRGGKIGTVGTANGYYPAHLHFEMRASDNVDVGAGYGMNPLNRLDPVATVAALRNAAIDDLSPSPLLKMLQSPGKR